MNKIMSDLSPPRYEFRIFTADATDIIGRLREMPGAGPSTRDQGNQAYIVRTAYDHISVKLREQRLEVKERIGQEAGLERWRYRLLAPLPVNARQAKDHVFNPLGLVVNLPDDTVLTAEALIELVEANSPPLALIGLCKDRVKWPLGQCNAEYVNLDAAGKSLSSIALESTDPNALRKLIRSIELDHFRNQSYITFLNEMRRET